MRFLFGALTGVTLSVLIIGYVFATTTTKYQSTLFPAQRVVIRNGKLETTPKPRTFKRQLSKPAQRMFAAEVKS